MNLENKITQDLKEAMKAKDQAALRSLRAIKAAIILIKTDGSGKVIDEGVEIKLLQKLVKQRQDSLDIYVQQGREDLASIEKEEIEVMRKYLPSQLSDDELNSAIQDIITQVGADSMKDMGKVMGMASGKLSGKADGKRIASVVKSLLSGQ